MSQNSRNPNPVGFLKDTRQLSHNREAAYGERRPHIVPLGYIPPFQIVRELTDPNPSIIRLYRRQTGASEVITSDMTSTGFQVVTFPDYKIWVYPGTVPLLLSAFFEGVYYMTITDGGGNVLTREDFCWMHQAGMTGFVKMEWFHQRNMMLPFGHINFVAPFKYWHWFQTELGKPSYPVERDVDARNGVEYVNTIVSWKDQRFVTRGDENFMDALSLVQHMDTVNVFFLGDEINAFRVIVTPDWQTRGDEAEIEVEIRSDQIVVTNGDALDDFDYEAECLAAAFVALTLMNHGSAEYNGGFFINQSGQHVSLIGGQLVLINNGGVIDLYTYNGAGGDYTMMVLAANQIVYESDTSTYYRNHVTLHLVTPVITTINTTIPTAYVITGIGLPGTFVEVYGRVNSASLTETLLAVGTNTEFESGITFNPAGNTGFRVKCSTVNCQHFQVTPWKNVILGVGIGVGVIEGTFIVG